MSSSCAERLLWRALGVSKTFDQFVPGAAWEKACARQLHILCFLFVIIQSPIFVFYFCMLFYLWSEIVCSGRLSNMSFVAIFFGFGFL